MASTSSIRIAYPKATLVSVGQATTVVIPLDRPVTLVGSGDIAHLRLHSRHVDAVHAVILNVDGRVVVRDLASASGVIVNGSRVGLAVIGDRDEITFGRTTFRLERGELVQAAVDQPSPEAELINEKWRLKLSGPVCLIGSGSGCDAPLPAEAVAPKHAIACAADGGWVLRGLEPNNFPRLNGRPKRRLRLPPGARVGIGAVELRFVSYRASVPSAREDLAPPRTDFEAGRDERPPPPVGEGFGPGDVYAMHAEVEVDREDVVRAPRDADEAREDRMPAPSDTAVERDDVMESPPSAPEPTLAAADAPETAEAASAVGPASPPTAANPDDDAAVPAAGEVPADEDDSEDDSAASKVGINYEAIKAWGPLAAAVAGVAGPARAAPEAESGATGGVRRWVLAGAAAAVLILGALVGWYVFNA